MNDENEVFDDSERSTFVCKACGKEWLMTNGKTSGYCFVCGGGLRHEWF